jgi:thioredoxin reductase
MSLDVLKCDALVVGGGPAGLSAALVLGRCMRRVLVCDSGVYRNAKSHALHCFLAHDGVEPAELLEMSRHQLKRYDTVDLQYARVDSIVGSEGGFLARVGDRDVHARAVVVATGVVDEVPKIDGIEPLFGKSIHVCPYCDGWENREGPIAVYGRADKGAGFALLLRQWTHDLVLCSNGPADLSDEQSRLLEDRGISVIETPIRKLSASDDGCLEAIHFTDGHKLQRRALFFNTGQHPRSPLLEKLGCAYADNGGVACDSEGRTSVKNVYVAGDVSRDVQLAIIAAAEGARAGLALNKDLLHRDGHL